MSTEKTLNVADPKRITIAEMAAVFGVGTMTIYNWRQGSSVREPLPCVAEPIGNGVRQRVYFKKTEVQAWIKQHGIADPWLAAKKAQKQAEKAPVVARSGRAKVALEKRA